MRPAASLLPLALFVLSACDGLSGDHAPPSCPLNEPLNGSPCSGEGAPPEGCTYAGSRHCPGTPNPLSTCQAGTWSGGGIPAGALRCGGAPFNSGASTCAPGDVSAFAPSWHPPTGFNQGKCTDFQIAAFVDCLTGTTDAATCKPFLLDAANKPCLQCAATPATAATYGPLVDGNVGTYVNVAGCVAQASGEVSATGCGAETLALSQCEQAACEANCPVSASSTGAEVMELLACERKSDATSCKAFATDAACADALTADGGAASICAQTSTRFADNAKAMVKLFCGGRPITDAGDGG